MGGCVRSGGASAQAGAVPGFEIADQPHQRQQQQEIEHGRANERRGVGGERLGLRGLLEQVGH
eukprot:gene28736-50616_t